MYDIIKVSFTGSDLGLPPRQERTLYTRLRELREHGAEYLIHGGCVGADHIADTLARQLGYKIIIFPQSTNPKKRADIQPRPCDTLHDPRPPLVRNRIIARNADILLACPPARVETIRSGTWHTVRRAREFRRKIEIICPDGTLIKEYA